MNKRQSRQNCDKEKYTDKKVQEKILIDKKYNQHTQLTDC